MNQKIVRKGIYYVARFMMPRKSYVVSSILFGYILCLLVIFFGFTNAVSEPLTHDTAGMSVAMNLRFSVAAGSKFCIYQSIGLNQHLSISVQVLSNGEKIGFEVKSPSTFPLYEIQYGDELNYADETTEEGDFESCFTSAKTIGSDTELSVAIYAFNEDLFADYFRNISHVEDLFAGFGDIFSKIYMNVVKARAELEHFKAHEHQDTDIQSSSLHYVNQWSLAQCCAMFVCAYVQMQLIKHMFRKYTIN